MQFGVIPRSDGPLARKLNAEARRRREMKRRYRLDSLIATLKKARAAPLQEQRPTVVMPAKRIQVDIATKHGFTSHDLMSARRDAVLCRARDEAVFQIARQTRMSLSQIAKLFDRDHTTILASIRRFADRNGLPRIREAQA